MATPYPPLPVIDFDAPPPGAPEPSSAPTGAETSRCDVCDEPIAGEPAGEGVYLWSRGGELVYEPAPLCEQCALAVHATALADLESDDEEEGLAAAGACVAPRVAHLSGNDATGDGLARRARHLVRARASLLIMVRPGRCGREAARGPR